MRRKTRLPYASVILILGIQRSVNFCVVNGQRRADEFVDHLKAAIDLVKDIIIETK